MTTQLPDDRYELKIDIEGNEPPLNKDDIIVLVMGATGTGKSAFISTVTGQPARIGHNLRSETASIQLYPYIFPDTNRRVILVDTVGFDDTRRSDADVLETMAAWLAASYAEKVVPAGIIFFQKVTDNRMGGTTIKNLKMFRKLCGEQCLRNVVLVTTMWDLVDPPTGEKREKELVSNPMFWGPLVERGAEVRRFQNTRQSGNDIVKLLAEKQRLPFQIQHELVDQRLKLADTAAGIAVDGDLQRLGQEHKQAVLELRKEKKRRIRQKDDLGSKITEEEAQTRMEEHRKTKDRRDILKKNLWRKIGDAILRAFSFQIRDEFVSTV